MKIILASESEWRGRLMSWLGLPFEVAASGVDESRLEGEEPEELVARLATAKAEAGKLQVTSDRRHTVNSQQPIANSQLRMAGGFNTSPSQSPPYQGGENTVVIGADTVIVVDGEIIGKPKDRQDAGRIIHKIQGRTHAVLTGLCVMNMENGDRRVEVEVTEVEIGRMNQAEIENYLKTGEWQGKAGAYQVLGAIAPYVVSIKDSTTNVIGLPLGLLKLMLNEMGVEVRTDLKRVVEREMGRVV